MVNTTDSLISTRIKGPSYILISLLSIISLACAGLLTWKQSLDYQADANSDNLQWLAISGACLFTLVLLIAWSVGRLIWKVVRLRKIRQQHVANMQQLNEEIEEGNRELEVQQEMQQAFMANSQSSYLMELAAELLQAQNISFWQLENDDTEMLCINALKTSRTAYDKGARITKDQYPSLFRLLFNKETIQYPHLVDEEVSQEVPKLGNLIHYYENSQLANLLIIPLEINGNVVGAAWFEHQEALTKWGVRQKSNAQFVATIVRMLVYKNLQEDIIKDLSRVLLQFDNFRNTSNFGMSWCTLPEALDLEKSTTKLTEKITTQAIVEEANEAASQGLFHESSSFLGNQLATYLPEGLIQNFVENDLKVENYEWERLHQGKVEVLLISLYGICVAGELVGIWLVNQNITATKTQIWQQNTLLRNTTSVITLLDDEFKIVHDSESVSKLGYTSESRIGNSLFDYIHPNDVLVVKDTLSRLQADHPNGIKEEWLSQIRVQHQGGTTGDYQVHLRSLHDQNHVTGILVELQEIGEQVNKVRKKQEELDFLNALVKYGDDVITVLDQSGTIVYASENSYSLTGYEASERVGRYGLEYIHQTDTAALEQAFAKLRDGKLMNYKKDIQFLHRNGKWQDMEVVLSRNQAGQMVAHLRDITQSKKAEAARKNREALLSTFLDNSNKLFMLTDSKGKIKFSGGSFEQHLGIADERLIGSFLAKLVHPDEVEALQRNLKALSHDPQAQVQMHVHLTNSEGTWSQFLLKGHGHLLEKAYSGLVIELEPIDLSDLDTTNLAIKADFFQSLANSFPHPLFFLDQHHTIKFANSATKALLGELPKGDFRQYIAEAEQQEVAHWLSIRQTDNISLTFRGEAEATTPHRIRLFELKGSKLKGVLLHIMPPNKEEEEKLAKAYQQIESLIKQVDDSQLALEQVETDEVLQDKVHAYRQQVTDLFDQVTEKEEELQSQMATVTELSATLDHFASLEEQSQQLEKHFQDIRQMIEKYQALTPDSDVEEQLVELHKLSELLNFDSIVNETSTYIEALQSSFSTVETSKG